MTDIVERLVALANSLGGTEEDDIMAGVAEIARLREALAFYANIDHWRKDVDGYGPITMPRDSGEIARRALEPKP